MKKSIFIACVIVLILGSGGYFIYDKSSKNNFVGSEEDNTKSKNNGSFVLEKGTFNMADEEGNVQVLGYGVLLKENEKDCKENCRIYDKVFFNVLRTENKDFQDTIKSWWGESGNYYADNKSVSLGCVKNDVLLSINYSDINGWKSQYLSKDDTNIILNSTFENPIVLEFIKHKVTDGGEAPDCYSHMSTIIIK